MGKKPDKSLVVALDIGTSKIAVLVGQLDFDNEIEIIGFGTAPSRGLKRGVVVNIESTVDSIQLALEEAELMADCSIQSVFTGIAGSHISSMNSHGIVAIRDREVNRSDVDRVIDAAKAVAIPADQQIIHILPQEFIIDRQEGVREPIGMSGVRLEAKVHIVTGAVSAAQNITKCVRHCGIDIGDIVLEQLASSHAVLTEDEKELGVCMVDIGGGTTDIAIFTEGAIRYTNVIPIAGDQVTNDVAVALRTPTQNAEEIKISHGIVSRDFSDALSVIEVPSVAGRSPRKIQLKSLTQVVTARYEELFSLVASQLRRSGFEDFVSAGIVLTGGASNIPGAAELAESIFKMPVRLGMPQNVSGLIDVRQNPSFSTGVGLMLHAIEQQNRGLSRFDLDRGVTGVWSRMRNWFSGNF
jgi:cell division protein FtsA